MLRAVVIAAAIWAAFLLPANAENFCVLDDQELDAAMAKHDEKLQFVGVNKMGRIFFVYQGTSTWTVWFVRAEGVICTGPEYVGEILRPGRET